MPEKLRSLTFRTLMGGIWLVLMLNGHGDNAGWLGNGVLTVFILLFVTTKPYLRFYSPSLGGIYSHAERDVSVGNIFLDDFA